MEKIAASSANVAFHQLSLSQAMSVKKSQPVIAMRYTTQNPTSARLAQIMSYQVMVYSHRMVSAESLNINVIKQVKSNCHKIYATDAKIVHQNIDSSEIFASQQKHALALKNTILKITNVFHAKMDKPQEILQITKPEDACQQHVKLKV